MKLFTFWIYVCHIKGFTITSVYRFWSIAWISNKVVCNAYDNLIRSISKHKIVQSSHTTFLYENGIGFHLPCDTLINKKKQNFRILKFHYFIFLLYMNAMNVGNQILCLVYKYADTREILLSTQFYYYYNKVTRIQHDCIT